ncbi:diaminopimelate decarboxylase [bacterium]|nr:diaminopimelate decarboxylase [bacterium]
MEIPKNRLLPDTAQINSLGHLEIGGVDVVDLAKRYGTPIYLYDETTLRNRMREFVSSLKETYPKSKVLYAGKAFLIKKMTRILAEEGLGLDVVSGGEIYIAKESNFPMENVYFHGNNKTIEELKFALEVGVRNIVVDNLDELKLLVSLVKRRPINILFRLTPGVDPHTHSYISTGKIDSKFGFQLNSKDLETAVELVKTDTFLNFKGLHCHIGSQIFDTKFFRISAEIMAEQVVTFTKKWNLPVEELDMGGGLGIAYKPSDDPPTPKEMAVSVADPIGEVCNREGIELPTLILEPGRYIVGNAGVTVYTVGTIKEIPEIRKYVSVDGGMADNPRPMLYQAEYTAFLANKMNKIPVETVTIAGRFCESGDILIDKAVLPTVENGDVLVISATGAYNYSMSSNYNMCPRPIVIGVRDGKDEVWVEREKYSDLVRLQR